MADLSRDSESAEINHKPPKGRRKKGKRCRTGCWNCRRKRRKCDGKRPACELCSQKGEVCQWGIKLSFRPENSYSVPDTHPSMQQVAALRRGTTIEFYDITHEIIRDYQTEPHSFEQIRNSSEQVNSNNHVRGISSPASSCQPPVTYERPTSTSTFAQPPESSVLTKPNDFNCLAATTCLNQPGLESPTSMASTESLKMLRSAAAQLLDLGCAPPLLEPVAVDHTLSSIEADADCLFHRTGNTPTSPTATRLSEYPNCDDGIFLPGSTYLELHSTLRNRILDTTRSAHSSRATSPRIPVDGYDTRESYTEGDYEAPSIGPNNLISPPASTPLFVELEWQEEYKLWKNWVDEIAPWLDKFDNDCHFGRTLPVMAQNHRHLWYSMLALSARQQERKHPDRLSSTSLALYQEAVHQLIPQLETRSTAVVASCVVLCVLEMMSCSPNMWRRHLDGCASLIQSVGINGFSVGLEKALFWCFARMDVCGGLISSQHTLIPIDSWSSETLLEHHIQLYRETSCFGLYADYSVFLCALVLDLFSSNYTEAAFTRRWSELFVYIEDWYTQRPPEMKSVLELNAPKGDYSRPFPVILFSNSAAVSGNQLYHTAALLMLQGKPRGVFMRSEPRSILWHARRICAISISNTQHSCWTNSIQPLWVAGKVMSHPSEHQAILDIYARIEKETGWGAKWRADDLKSYWGDLDG
ncbi:fungal-specific transcription factor domain-containing protein [Ustulina deusta]|nr:fungal-specific transcription factor domain-containing protein [Ustulina deusta]